MLTKGQIANEAFAELMISGLTSAPDSNQITSFIRLMDITIPSLRNKGLCLSYAPSESYIEIDPNQESGINQNEERAVILSMAKRLCARYRVPCPREISAECKEAIDNIFCVTLPTRQNNPYLPLGAGYRNCSYGSTYYPQYFIETDVNQITCDTLQLKVGETNNFNIYFNDYLNDGEAIDSFTISDNTAVTINSSSESDGVISLNCTGVTAGFNTILITITTDATPARIFPQTVDFNIA